MEWLLLMVLAQVDVMLLSMGAQPFLWKQRKGYYRPGFCNLERCQLVSSCLVICPVPQAP